MSPTQPSRSQFHELARDYTVVPVWRELLGDLITPVSAFARLCGDSTEGFLFESVEHGERWSRWSFIGRNPLVTLASRGDEVVVAGDLPHSVPRDRGMLAAIEELLALYRSPSLEGLPPLHGGVVGYLGYDIVREIEALPDTPVDDRGFPDAVISVIGELAAFDHFRQHVTLIENVIVPAGADDEMLDALYDEALERLERLASDGASPLDEPLIDPPDMTAPIPESASPTTSDSYRASVEAARERILAGDIFQVVLSQRFDFELDADPFDLYRVLRQVNPSPYMYFVRHSELTLVGSSPEPMVKLIEGEVISRPIAGTRRRGRTPEDDKRLAAELIEHPKERAEHVMLVDLARNDVGRVVRYGTEKVDEMMSLERYSHVMHLTSQVSGQLAAGLGPVDVLRATLPAGTVSGAPKVSAMKIIDELEPVKRGPYAGVVGYIDFAGNVDTAIAIRTMVIAPDGRASVQAGAGIVADSIAADEDLECHNKVRALLAAVPGARAMTAQRRSRTRTYLDGIVAAHRRDAARDPRDPDELMARARACPPARGFRDAIIRSRRQGGPPALIAEVKRRSPSKGPLRPDLDPATLAAAYEAGGATCLSVLTDVSYFGGSVADLRQARGACSLPVLRKDFTVCGTDVADARIMGADAVLLIVAALDDGELTTLLATARGLGMDALVEIHDEAELVRAVAAGADMIGVNQRDLFSFEVDRDRAVALAPLIPEGAVRVAESGIGTAEDVAALTAAGFDAMLIGESLVVAEDPGDEIKRLFGQE